MNRPALLRLLAMGACAVALSGCVSLLPKTKPATLYRFGETPSVQAGAPATAQVGVFKSGGLFQRESAGDRLMTVTGDKIAYIARARWATPASVMFDQALLTAFDSDTGPTRVVIRGEPATSRYILRLDVRSFETRYDRGPEASPEVLVRVRVLLVPSKDRDAAREEMFEARVRAGDNRVGEIVRAYDTATSQVIGKLVAWTNAQVAG